MLSKANENLKREKNRVIPVKKHNFGLKKNFLKNAPE